MTYCRWRWWWLSKFIFYETKFVFEDRHLDQLSTSNVLFSFHSQLGHFGPPLNSTLFEQSMSNIMRMGTVLKCSKPTASERRHLLNLPFFCYPTSSWHSFSTWWWWSPCKSIKAMFCHFGVIKTLESMKRLKAKLSPHIVHINTIVHININDHNVKDFTKFLHSHLIILYSLHMLCKSLHCLESRYHPLLQWLD